MPKEITVLVQPRAMPPDWLFSPHLRREVEIPDYQRYAETVIGIRAPCGPGSSRGRDRSL